MLRWYAGQRPGASHLPQLCASALKCYKACMTVKENFVHAQSATWVGPSFAEINGERIAVGYRHHLNRVNSNPGEETTFFHFCPRPTCDEGMAFEWMTDFSQAVQKSGKLLLADLSRKHGTLCQVGFIDCGGRQLLFELKSPHLATVVIGQATLHMRD